jgi:integrase
MFRPPPPEPRWLTQDEFGRLHNELSTKHLRLAARFAVSSLLRMRSMLSLTWDRIDLRQRRLWIPGTQMKGKRSHGLPLSRESVRILRELKTLNPEGTHVFQWNGRKVDDCNTLAFQEAVIRAKVAPCRWHDLRHTGASWLVQSGVTLQELMEYGGWKSYAMVLRYAHLAPDHLATAAEKVGTLVAQSRSKARKRK